MKHCSSLLKFVGAGVLATGLALTPAISPTLAQTNTESQNPTFDTTPLQETKNDFNNLGWLGLIGLLGLVKLFQKRQEVHHHNLPVENSGYSNPDTASRSYADPNAVGTTYTEPDVVNRPGYTEPNVMNRPAHTDEPDIDVADRRDYQK